MLKKYFKKFSKNYQQKSTFFPDYINYSQDNLDNINVDAYKNNAVVYRCVSLITTSASHVPWQIYRNHHGIRELIINHPAGRILKHPNEETSGADFFVENIANLLLYGESFILANLGSDSKPHSFTNLHPSYTQQVLSNGKAVAYLYKANNMERNFPLDPITRKSRVLHLKNYYPTNPNKGLSVLSSAAKSINIHSKIMEWNRSLLKNAIKPSGALVFQDGNGHLSDEQFERLQQQFYDNFSGSANSGKPLVLEGGLKWQETNNAEKFEKFIELKDSSARDIAIAFNVPPQLLGINGDNTYSNMQEARLALWEENIIPLLDKYSDALSSWLSYWFEEDISVDFDRESISVLTKRRESIWSKISRANFMTINEKRALVGLGPLADCDVLNAGYENGNEADR